ncbi:DUF2569 domain-containing protein [Allopontixanthobacter sp.]|uniref:DUF2569 domain-containing protein n=1 Tax=Allopontixanthobacter sp. TaxID=2906452 RepID=UPI002AB81BA9|nr:DUF2569 domain-containing protein [Allopontixanthobacter sp.]MDZ4307003.1 DUF2569 domain-containing protein [Allopontixanthobacter sp.]
MFNAASLIACRKAMTAFAAKAGAKLHGRSVWLIGQFNRRMEIIITIWLALFMAAAIFRLAIARAPVHGPSDFIQLFLPYALIALAPVLAYRLAIAAFPIGQPAARPSFHFYPFGTWRRLDALDAQNHKVFGPTGFLASLILGLLLNVVFRSFEFLLAVPAMNSHAPEWGVAIFRVMAFDVIAMNTLYAICFVMALRSIPLFPKMLGLCWLLDITSQLVIANYVSAAPQLPGEVAQALGQLLQGNVTKVLISAGLWLPYLLLSDRVNVTYRMRGPVEE